MSDKLPPRDSNGRFRDVVTDNAEPIDDEGYICTLPDDDVSDATEWVNVTISLLEQAIEEAKEHDGVVRMAVRSKEVELDDEWTQERGVVLVKPGPSSERVVGLGGRYRRYRDDE